MGWVEVFIVFMVSHLAGDFLLQTNWQAANKRFGLTAGGEASRALFNHMTTYMLAFVPALVWLTDELSIAETIGVAALIAVPHTIQDDFRLLAGWIRRVKRIEPIDFPMVTMAVDQTFHVISLMLLALLVRA